MFGYAVALNPRYSALIRVQILVFCSLSNKLLANDHPEERAMHTVTLPNTDLVVSQLCLGSTDIGSTISRENSFRLLDAFLSLIHI